MLSDQNLESLTVEKHDVNIGVVMMALTAHKSLPLVRLKRANRPFMINMFNDRPH